MAKKSSKVNDRKARLAALREKLETTDYSSSGSQGFWSPNEGSNTIRILPEVGEMDFFYTPVGKHWMPDNTSVYCPHFTTEGDLPCPVCDLQNELWNAGDNASRELAKKLRVRKSFWMNVVVRSREGTTGPFIYTPGITVFEALVAMINDPDYGDIFDEEDGLDVMVKKSGTGLDTKYDVLAKRKPSPLMESDDEIDRVFDEARDLSWVEVSMDPKEDEELADGRAVYLLPYDRIVDELGLKDGVRMAPESDEDDDYFQDEDDEEEEVSEPVQEVRRRRARRGRK